MYQSTLIMFSKATQIQQLRICIAVCKIAITECTNKRIHTHRQRLYGLTSSFLLPAFISSFASKSFTLQLQLTTLIRKLQ